MYLNLSSGILSINIRGKNLSILVIVNIFASKSQEIEGLIDFRIKKYDY